MRYSRCPPRDGDADVRKGRGAAFEIPFSNRDPSSKRTNVSAELLESTLTAREDHVSSVHGQIQTRAKINFVSTQEHLLPESPSLPQKLKNNYDLSWSSCTFSQRNFELMHDIWHPTSVVMRRTLGVLVNIHVPVLHVTTSALDQPCVPA